MVNRNQKNIRCLKMKQSSFYYYSFILFFIFLHYHVLCWLCISLYLWQRSSLFGSSSFDQNLLSTNSFFFSLNDENNPEPFDDIDYRHNLHRIGLILRRYSLPLLARLFLPSRCFLLLGCEGLWIMLSYT